MLRYQPGPGLDARVPAVLVGRGVARRPARRGLARAVARARGRRPRARCGCGARETGLWERDPGAPIGFEAQPDGRRLRARRPRPRLRGRQGRRAASLRQELDAGAAARRASQAANFTRSRSRARRRSWPPARDLLVNDGGGWRVDEGARDAAALGPAAARSCSRSPACPDGGAVAAGRDVVIERDSAGSPWRFSDQPLPGSTVVAAAALPRGRRGCARSCRCVPPSWRYPPADDVRRARPERAAAAAARRSRCRADGFVLRETATGWRDEQHTAFAGSGDDRPIKSDPVLDFALDADGNGWAVGGWSGEQDAAGRGSSGRNAAGRARPRARADRRRVPLRRRTAPPPGARSAAGAAAGRAGRGSRSPAMPQCETPCADLALQDIRPDRSLAAALAKVAALRAQPGGPRMLLYTGGRLAPGHRRRRPRRDARATRRCSASRRVPVYPAVSAADARRQARAPSATAFANFLAPFGGGPPPPGVDPPHPGRAAGARRAHALRVRLRRAGGHRARDRDRQLGRLAGGERPAPEPARAAAPVAGGDAGGREGARDPGDRDRAAATSTRASRRRLNTATDGDERRGMLVEGGASAYFFERPEENRAYQISGGAARHDPRVRTGTLGYRSPASATRATRTRRTRCSATAATCSPRSTSRSATRSRTGRRSACAMIPLIDDLSIQAVDGTLLRRSRPALFQGLGRRPLARRPVAAAVGAATPTRAGSRPLHRLPARAVPGGGLLDAASTPEYEFLSSDPDIGDFVRQDPNSTNLRKPFLGADDKPVTDCRSGLFCAFNAGVTTVTVRAGGLSYAQQVRILPGSVQRPCGTRPLRPDRFRRAAAGALPPRRRRPRRRAATSRRCRFQPPASAPGGARAADSAAGAAAVVPRRPSSRSPSRLGFLPPVPLPVPPARAAAEPAQRRLRPRVREAARGGGRARGDAGLRPLPPRGPGLPAGYVLGALVLAALAGATIFGGPAREPARHAPAARRSRTSYRRPDRRRRDRCQTRTRTQTASRWAAVADRAAVASCSR